MEVGSWCFFALLIAVGFSGRMVEASAAEASGFYAANERYRAGRFDEAERGYRSLIETGRESGALYYNLGNALVKQGRNGEALWAYLRALRLMPRDPDLRANFTYVRSLLPQAAAVSVHPPGLATWLGLNGAFTTGELAGLAIVGVWLSAVAWGLVGWLPRTRPALRPAAWVLTLLAAGALCALVSQTVWIEGGRQAVAIKDAKATFSPETAGTVHFTLPEGAVVRVIHQQLGWAQIQRGDGRGGWVPLDSVKPL